MRLGPVGLIEMSTITGKTNYEEKQEAFTNRTSVAFIADNCKWNVKESPKQTPKQGKWHDPVDNPQITLWTQNGNYNPATFGVPRPNKKYHQGVDLFCTEGSNVYACLDGIVESITTSPEG